MSYSKKAFLIVLKLMCTTFLSWFVILLRSGGCTCSLSWGNQYNHSTANPDTSQCGQKRGFKGTVWHLGKSFCLWSYSELIEGRLIRKLAGHAEMNYIHPLPWLASWKGNVWLCQNEFPMHCQYFITHDNIRLTMWVKGFGFFPIILTWLHALELQKFEHNLLTHVNPIMIVFKIQHMTVRTPLSSFAF